MTDEHTTAKSPEELVELALRGEPERFERPELLKQAHAALEDAGKADDARKLLPLIFALHMHANGPGSPHFGPSMSGTTEDGKPWGWPDLTELNEDDWDIIRATVADSVSEVAARCADLVWENKHEFPMAEEAFTNYLASADLYFERDWVSELTDALGRAGALAGYAKRDDWAEQVVTTTWVLIDRAEAGGDTKAAKRILDVLLEAKGKLAEHVDFDAVLNRSLALFEAIVAEGEDLYVQQRYLEQAHAAAKAAGNDEAEATTARALVECLKKQAAEREATGSAMVAASFIEEALTWCEAAHIGTGETDVLKAELQRLYAASGDEAQTFSHQGEVPREEVDRLIDPYRGHSSADILGFLTQDPRLLMSEAKAFAEGQERLSESLTSIFSMNIFHGDFKVRQLNTYDEKLEHAALQAASLTHQIMSLMVLSPVLDLLEEQDPNWPAAVHDFFSDVPWLKPWRVALMDVAIERVRAEDYVSALHILVFWVEGCLRDLLAAGGVPIIKPGGVKLLGALISAARRMSGIDPDLIFFIDALLCRPLSTNLRNHVGHALLESDDFNRKNTLLVLLAALRLGSYRVTPKEQHGLESE